MRMANHSRRITGQYVQWKLTETWFQFSNFQLTYKAAGLDNDFFFFLFLWRRPVHEYTTVTREVNKICLTTNIENILNRRLSEIRMHNGGSPKQMTSKLCTYWKVKWNMNSINTWFSCHQGCFYSSWNRFV